MSDIKIKKRWWKIGEKGADYNPWKLWSDPGARGVSRATAPPLAARPYWQLVNRVSLKLLSTILLVYYRVALIHNTKSV
jgi:hypothetical protein